MGLEGQFGNFFDLTYIKLFFFHKKGESTDSPFDKNNTEINLLQSEYGRFHH